MEIKQCYLVENRCYIQNKRMKTKPVGIVVHSTGADNRELRRYVNPVGGQSDYDSIISDIGKTKYNNHWNRSAASACVHAFIGTNASGVIEVYETLPYDVCCWGCGNGSKGSYNYDPMPCIQFEICEDKTDPDYFEKVFDVTAEYLAYLCERFNLPVDTIRSHAEAHKIGYASNHSDCDHWLKKYGKSMNWLRDKVTEILNAKPEKAKTLHIIDVEGVEDSTRVELEKLGYNVKIYRLGV